MVRSRALARYFFAVGFFVVVLVGVPTAASGSSWLDQAKPANWNAIGMPLPTAVPAELPIDPRAAARERQAETAEDEALAALGWRFFAPYQGGWEIKVVQAGSSYDGMGRPWDYQVFVFAGGVFAGTLAPEPMDSRTDGALDDVSFFGDVITAQFRRYATADPLCCPSGKTTVQYRVERSPQGPLVVPISADTRFTPRATAPTTPVAQPTPEATMWEAAFEAAHGRVPNDQDRADRAWSLDFLATNGRPPSDADWVAHFFGRL